MDAHLIVCILKEQQLPLVQVLHALLPAHKLDHLTERLARILAPQEEPAAALEQHGEVLHIRAREVVKADFEHVQDDMWRDDAELGQVGQEGDVAHPDFRELLDDVLLALQVPELLVQL